jgi:hypothetical protein
MNRTLATNPRNVSRTDYAPILDTAGFSGWWKGAVTN